ncbi:MAG: CBS domain-containing protein [Polyangiaceae bacterium]
MDEHLDDELEIMSEQARQRVDLDVEVFEQPLSVLCRRPAVTVNTDAPVEKAVAVMREHGFGAVLVTDKGKLAGIITERDLMMKVGLDGDAWRSRSVTQLMTANPDALHADDAVKFVMNRMHVGGYRHVPVVNEKGEPLHVISLRDVVRFVLDQFPKLVTNIPSRPSRGAPPWGG